MSDLWSSIDRKVDAKKAQIDGHIVPESVYRFQPVDFSTFVESKQYCGFIKLSKKQLDACYAMLYGCSFDEYNAMAEKPLNIFDNPRFNVATLLWGKGSILAHSDIITADGKRMTMEESARKNLPLILYSKTDDGKIVKSLSTPAIKKPNKENCFKVTTSHGHISECSEDHQFFTVGGWKKLKAMKTGDWIYSAQKTNIEQIYNETPALSRWVGYIIGDGNTSADHRILFFASKEEIIKDYCDVVESFGATCRILPHNTPISKFISFKFTGKRGDNILNNHAKRLGIYGKLSSEKRIPIEIMFSSTESRRALIEGLYATDGWCCNHCGNSGYTQYEIGYISKNRKLIEDLDFMLRGFGIVGKISKKKTMYKGEERPYWQHLVMNANMQLKFIDNFNIPSKPYEQNMRDHLNNVAKKRGFRTDPALTKIVAEEVKHLNTSIGAEMRSRIKQGQTLSYETMYGLESVKHLVNDELMLEQIKSIEPLGMQDVYTFTVEGTHNYLQGGLLHHNSGKDTICSLMTLYIAYFCGCCCKNPQQLLGIPDNDAIDIVNVAYSADQANRAFFEKVKQRLLHNPWFRKYFNVEESGAVINEKNKEMTTDTIKVGANAIMFPNLVRLFSRHCVSGDSLVLLKDGWKKVKDIKVGDDVRTADDKFYKITEIMNREADVHRVVLRNGLSIKCTLDHPFLVVSEGVKKYKKLSELSVGSNVWYKLNVGFDKHKKSILTSDDIIKHAHTKFVGEWNVDKDMSWLLGMVIAEGSVREDYNKGFMVCQKSGKINDNLVRILDNKFKNYSVVKVPKGYNNNGFVHSDDFYTYHMWSIEFIQVLQQLGMHQVNHASKKTFPYEIINYGDEAVKYFIAGMFDGDGWLGSKQLIYASTSQELLYGLSFCLHNFGITCFIYKDNDVYKLQICNTHRNKFLEMIPTIKSRKRYHESKASVSYNKSLYFHGLNENIYEYAKEKNLLNDNASRDLRQKDVIIKDYFKGKQALVNEPSLKYFYDNDLYSSEIISIEYCGKETVYNYFEPKTQEMIVNNILTLDSEQESTEGLNLLCFTMDEADAFKAKTQVRNADKIFNMLQSSAESRFGSKYKGFIISFPRTDRGFMMKMMELAKVDLHMYADRAFTWEVKKEQYEKSGTFDFDVIKKDGENKELKNTYKVPLDFKSFFTRNPTMAKQMYMCMPPGAESPFIEYVDKLYDCVDKSMKPIFELEPVYDTYTEHVRKRLIGINVPQNAFSTEYVLTIDLGQKHDKCALSIMHRERDRAIHDLSISWRPYDPESQKKYVVDFINVREIVKEMAKHIHFKIMLDKWQSSLFVEDFRAAGLSADTYTLSVKDYNNFMDFIYTKRIILLNNNELIEEIKGLERTADGKVDHQAGNATEKDMTDTIVGGIRTLFLTELVATKEGGEFITENLQYQGGDLIQ